MRYLIGLILMLGLLAAACGGKAGSAGKPTPGVAAAFTMLDPLHPELLVGIDGSQRLQLPGATVTAFNFASLIRDASRIPDAAPMMALFCKEGRNASDAQWLQDVALFMKAISAQGAGALNVEVRPGQQGSPDDVDTAGGIVLAFCP